MFIVLTYAFLLILSTLLYPPVNGAKLIDSRIQPVADANYALLDTGNPILAMATDVLAQITNAWAANPDVSSNISQTENFAFPTISDTKADSILNLSLLYVELCDSLRLTF